MVTVTSDADLPWYVLPPKDDPMHNTVFKALTAFGVAQSAGEELDAENTQVLVTARKVFYQRAERQLDRQMQEQLAAMLEDDGDLLDVLELYWGD